MKFITPKISLQELKKSVIELSFDSNSISTLDFYKNEFLRHYCAIIIDLNEQQSKRIYMLLSKSEEISERLSETYSSKVSLKQNEFEIIKTKLFFIIDDLINFITDENITDRSIGDIKFD